MKSNFEKFIFTKVELWVLVLLAFLGLFGLMGFAYFLRLSLETPSDSALSKMAVNLSTLPERAVDLYRNGVEVNAAGELVQRDPRNVRFPTFSGFQPLDPDFTEDGYLLVCAYDDTVKNSTVYLYDLKQGRKVWEWITDVDDVLAKSPSASQRLAQLPTQPFNPHHAYLMPDGDLIFLWHIVGLLMRVDPQGQVKWLLDGSYHHSIERMADGNFIVPISPAHQEGVHREDGYAIVSPHGEELERRNVNDILSRHGYDGLMNAVGPWEFDRIHLNDVEPILANDAFVQAGDLALSCRNISTVFLYRPSEDRILWLSTGPWLNQHDVDYQGEGRFTIFNNDYHREKDPPDQRPNSIYLYDMATETASLLLDEPFALENLATPEQGLHRMLRNGDAFVELTDQHQLARVAPDGLRWRYAHALSQPGRAGRLFWCRYFHRDEVDLSWLQNQTKQEAP